MLDLDLFKICRLIQSMFVIPQWQLYPKELKRLSIDPQINSAQSGYLRLKDLVPGTVLITSILAELMSILQFFNLKDNIVFLTRKLLIFVCLILISNKNRK